MKLTVISLPVEQTWTLFKARRYKPWYFLLSLNLGNQQNNVCDKTESSRDPYTNNYHASLRMHVKSHVNNTSIIR